MILTDSNGREATPDSIMNHVPREWRGRCDIRVVPAYTTEEAFNRIGSGDIDVSDAVVIIDLLTNDVRGTRQRAAVSPDQLVWKVDQLRQRIRVAGATAVVVCQIKPMEVVDVTTHNIVLGDYLKAQRMGYACRTQIRRRFLKRDGFHVQPQFDSLIDQTYACAMLGLPVPHPTPMEEFAPEFTRRRYGVEWPSLVGRSEWGQRVGSQGPRNIHGC